MKPILTAIACVGLASCHAGSTPQATAVVPTARGGIEYIRITPASGVRHRMILAHGFLRDATTMEHLAKALARHGVETLCPNLRRSRPWDGKADDNARDLIALRKSLGWDRVIYAGYSAGGLSALLAAAHDPSACEGLLLFDPVDRASAGLRVANQIHAPVVALLAEPGPGNARGNAGPVLAALAHCQRVLIPGASHCDFEANPAAACYLMTGDKINPDRVREVHARMLTAAKRLLDSLAD